MSYGWNSTCYQILNPGMAHWFPSLNRAVVGYVRRNRMLLVAGAPVCMPERLFDVCSEFESFARRQGCGVCYVCAEERLRSLFEHSPSHATVTLGAQPVWHPQAWPDLIQRQASLRSQLNRCRNKAVSVEPLAPEYAAKHRGIRKILGEWLAARRLPPMHFLVEPDVLNEANSERVILVAKREGVPVAYLVACPIAARKGYLVELLARARAAPNGTSELLIDGAMRRFAGAGISRVTLGLVALAHAAESGIRRNPFWLRTAMQFARLHANRFYNFRGLEQFRVKLAPCGWEPVYAISNEKRFSPRALYSIGAAFAGISPWLAIGTGVVKAVQQEVFGNVSWRRW
jgi:phosphatidylglycerol lysyltransferase